MLERRLADSRVSLEHERGRVCRPIEKRLDAAQLLLPADQLWSLDSDCHCSLKMTQPGALGNPRGPLCRGRYL